MDINMDAGFGQLPLRGFDLHVERAIEQNQTSNSAQG